MRDKYHVIAGVAIGCAMMSGMKLINSDMDKLYYGAGVAITAIGAFVPNLDNDMSMKGDRGGLSSVIGQFLLELGNATGFRKGMHSVWAAIVGSLLVWSCTGWTYLPALTGFFIGYMSHLIMDSFTPFGICYFPKFTWDFTAYSNWEQTTLYPLEQPGRHYTKLAKVKQSGITAMLTTLMITMFMSGVVYEICYIISTI